MRQIRVIKINKPIEYNVMLAQQQDAREALETGSVLNTVFLLEHTPTITLGRRARREHILAANDDLARLGIEVVETDRGGDVTYHGPGQLVVYPILNLREWRLSVDWYLRALEETVIQLLRVYGLSGERMNGFTGVWVNGAKVAAIGVGVRHWITWHGLALNVDPDETHWNTIVPCGISDKPVTTLSRLMKNTPVMDEVAHDFVKAFTEIFACEVDHDGA